MIKDLCFSGGAMKGIGYIGAYKALTEKKILQEPLDSITGCSVGSIMGFLILLGYSADELHSFVTSFNYDDVKHWDFINFFQTWGIEKGIKLIKFFSTFLYHKTNQHDLTFKQLFDLYPTKFTIVATNLKKHESVYYNHINSPDLSVMTAIRRSITLPFLMTPQFEDDSCLVDGALLDNFPIQQCPDKETTLGFCFKAGRGEHAIDNLEDYAYNIFCCIFDQNTKYKLSQIKSSKIIQLDPEDFNGHNLKVSVEDRQKLHDKCYQDTLAEIS